MSSPGEQGGRPTALVTGAARRVGRAIALELAANGFDVVLHGHTSTAELSETADACRCHGATVHTVQADLTTTDGIAEVARAARSAFSALNVLVNNASRFSPLAFEQIDVAGWQEMLDLNLRAPFLLSQALLPLLRAADATRFDAPEGQHGVVVHLVDIGAQRPVRGYTHYSVSKAGLAMLVKAMAVELAPDVRTVGISPGQVAWPEDYGDPRKSAILKRVPLRRIGTPEDVARLVRFVVCEGHYMNGAVIPVDGGLSTRY